MAPNTKRVFYVNAVAAPVYLEILAKRPDIQVDKLVNETPDAEAEPVLAQAHAYQIGSSRQELVSKLQGYAPLLDRCPNLLVLSTNGAGFDTVSLRDATEAGVAVVNQAGGNKEGVAEHVMAMMLTLSKRIIMSDHAMRSGAAYDRRGFHGRRSAGPHHRDCRHWPCRQPGGGAVPRTVPDAGDCVRSLSDRGADRREGRREGGDAGGDAAAGGLCLDQLPAHGGDAGHDGRGAVRDDADACVFHYDRTRRHP